MSGGHFDGLYGGDVAYHLFDEWRDEEVNELFFDLFGCGWNERDRFGRRLKESQMHSEFGPHGGGLFESLDYWLAGDTSEADYRDDLRRFKEKWLIKRTPKSRVEYYKNKLREYTEALLEEFEVELGLQEVEG